MKSSFTNPEDLIYQLTTDKICPGLERIQDLLYHLGNPEKNLPIIHIAGTNGKGSTCAMLESITRHADYKTGLYTSPYLHSINEVIRINNQPISDPEFINLINSTRPALAKVKERPSYFEFKTALAFLYFAQQNCDLIILEVGLGGRLDATNVIADPLACLITQIDYDHQQYLGNTLIKIASEKAGIIKPNRPVIIMDQAPGILNTIKTIAAQKSAPAYLSQPQNLTLQNSSLTGSNLTYTPNQTPSLSFHLPLLGAHQLRNLALVLQPLQILPKYSSLQFSPAAISGGLAQTEWPGRFQVLSQNPLFIFDGAHNPAGLETFLTAWQDLLPGQKGIFIVGVMADKDYSQMISKLAPYAHAFITLTPDYHRALPASDLAITIQKIFPGPIHIALTPDQAVKLALTLHQQSSLPIAALGSLYLADPIARAVKEKIT